MYNPGIWMTEPLKELKDSQIITMFEASDKKLIAEAGGKNV